MLTARPQLISKRAHNSVTTRTPALALTHTNAPKETPNVCSSSKRRDSPITDTTTHHAHHALPCTGLTPLQVSLLLSGGPRPTAPSLTLCVPRGPDPTRHTTKRGGGRADIPWALWGAVGPGRRGRKNPRDGVGRGNEGPGWGDENLVHSRDDEKPPPDGRARPFSSPDPLVSLTSLFR